MDKTTPATSSKKLNTTLIYWLALALLTVSMFVALLFFTKTLFHKINATYAMQQYTEKEFQQIKQQIAQQQHAIIATQTHLQALGQRNRPHYWQLNEAQYLTQLAAWNLLVNHNVTLALQLLTTANQRLSTLASPLLLPLQQSLAHDIQQLKNTTVPNLSDILLKIDTLGEQIEKAPMLSITPPKITPSTETTTLTTGWKKTWQTSLDTLKKAVIIRKHPNQVAIPVIAPEQQTLLKQNIAFQLSILQWAAVNHHANIYHNRLHVIKAWIERYFVQRAATTQTVIETLTALNKINLNPTLSNLSDSLNLFQKSINGQEPSLDSLPSAPPRMPTEPQVLPS